MWRLLGIEAVEHRGFSGDRVGLLTLNAYKTNGFCVCVCVVGTGRFARCLGDDAGGSVT